MRPGHLDFIDWPKKHRHLLKQILDKHLYPPARLLKIVMTWSSSMKMTQAINQSNKRVAKEDFNDDHKVP